MKKAPQTRVAGVGTAVGAVILGSVLWLGCQPGALPCEKDDWKGVCAGGDALPGAGGSSNTGGSSNGGNAGGNTGGSSGSTGGASGDAGMPATGDLGSKAVASCANWKTVKDMDKFFASKCGNMAACHNNAMVFGDYTSADFYKKLTDSSFITKFDCIGVPMADMSDPTKGAFWGKIQNPPTCSASGKMPGPAMPLAPTAMPLTADEKTCLENYLKVIAGK
jgi:hypothetical protein